LLSFSLGDLKTLKIIKFGPFLIQPDHELVVRILLLLLNDLFYLLICVNRIGLFGGRLLGVLQSHALRDHVSLRFGQEALR